MRDAKMMNRSLAMMGLVFAMVMNASIARAATHIPPNELLEDTKTKMFDALNANRDRIKQDPDVAQQLVEEILLPHLDFISASKWVLGKYWRRATPQVWRCSFCSNVCKSPGNAVMPDVVPAATQLEGNHR